MTNKMISMYRFKACVFFILLGLMYLISWNYNKNTNGVIYTDMEGYYMYLPAVFIYHGFEHVPVKTTLQYQVYPGTNKIFTKYTCGVAMMQLPFFIIIHSIVSVWVPSQADGYSHAYAWSIILAACFYSLAGLFIIAHALYPRYGPGISVVTASILFLGSNLYYYTICQPGMSHIYSFFLFAAIVYLTPGLFHNSSYKKWMLYGFIFGMIILIRPTNTILVLYPLLYGCYSLASFYTRITFFSGILKYILVCVAAFLIPFIPQIIYWYYISGHFIFYSYNQEKFLYWSQPKILKVLFDVQNGWLLYSPIMLLALAGIFINIKKRLPEAFVTLILLSIATYVFASWWAWWFGGAFGHRCYVEYYPLLSFGLASFIGYAIRNKYHILAMTSFLSICIYLNLRLTYIYLSTAPWDGPAWSWSSFAAILKRII